MSEQAKKQPPMLAMFSFLFFAFSVENFKLLFM